MNKALLIGNVTRDPEIKEVNGSKVASLSLATNRKYRSKESNELKEIVEYHNLNAWGRTAEVIEQYVKKGHKLAIEGEIRTRSYEKDGVKHYRTDITIERMEMLTSKGASSGTPKRPDGAEASGLPNAADYASDEPEVRIEDIPF